MEGPEGERGGNRILILIAKFFLGILLGVAGAFLLISDAITYVIKNKGKVLVLFAILSAVLFLIEQGIPGKPQYDAARDSAVAAVFLSIFYAAVWRILTVIHSVPEGQEYSAIGIDTKSRLYFAMEMFSVAVLIPAFLGMLMISAQEETAATLAYKMVTIIVPLWMASAIFFRKLIVSVYIMGALLLVFLSAAYLQMSYLNPVSFLYILGITKEFIDLALSMFVPAILIDIAMRFAKPKAKLYTENRFGYVKYNVRRPGKS